MREVLGWDALRHDMTELEGKFLTRHCCATPALPACQQACCYNCMQLLLVWSSRRPKGFDGSDCDVYHNHFASLRCQFTGLQYDAMACIQQAPVIIRGFDHKRLCM